MDGATINWLAVAGAALSAFLLGGIWYGPLFGKAWQRAIGLSDEQIADANMAMIFGLTFVLNLFLASFIALAIGALSPEQGATAVRGAMLGVLLSLAFVVPVFAVNYLFARHSLALFAIDSGFILLQFVLMGAILGAFGG